MKNGKIIILSGASGSGKTTISKYLVSKISSLQLSVSCTTRKIRKNEINGKDYYFISTKNFISKIQNKQFIEWEEVYKNIFYGTLKSQINKILKEKKNILFDVDVKGGLNLKKKYYNSTLSIFILVSRKNLKNRLIQRKSENLEKINIRLNKAKIENALSSLFDYTFRNINLTYTKKRIEKVVSRFLK